jgi:hypothetical protein
MDPHDLAIVERLGETLRGDRAGLSWWECVVVRVHEGVARRARALVAADLPVWRPAETARARQAACTA